MGNNNGQGGVGQLEVIGLCLAVVVAVLFAAAVLLIYFWDRICAGIVLTALEQGVRGLPAVR